MAFFAKRKMLVASKITHFVHVIDWTCFEANVSILYLSMQIYSSRGLKEVAQQLLPQRLIEVFTRQKVYEGSGILEE